MDKDNVVVDPIVEPEVAIDNSPILENPIEDYFPPEGTVDHIPGLNRKQFLDAETPVSPEPVETPTTVPEVPVSDENSIEYYKQQLERSRQLINSMAANVQGASVPTNGTTQTPAYIPPSLEQILDSVDLDEALDSSENFAALLEQVAQTVKYETIRQMQQEMRQEIPALTNQQIQHNEYLQSKRNSFYATNPDLEPHKDYVAYAANRLYQQNPNLPLDEILTQVGGYVRNSLGLSTQVSAPVRQVPALAGGTRSARSAPPQKSETQKHIDMLLS